MVNNKVPLIAKVCIVVVALLLLPAFVFAQQPSYGFHKGDREFSIFGRGYSDNNVDNTVFTTSLSLGYFFTDNLEAELRQSLSFIDTHGDNFWGGSTELAADYHFDLDRFQPLIGASIAYNYGDDITDTWAGGPEAGVKYFINETTFIRALVQYQFPFRDSFNDGNFIYGLGLGVRF
ncbi:MAG: outer membrane beta-barrel protein [Thermodesulfovibrionales bacterium]